MNNLTGRPTTARASHPTNSPGIRTGSATSLAGEFLAMHVPGKPLLMPNAWDAGSAKVLASLGFAAIATTSSGFAASLGRLDGQVTREESLEHSRLLADAVPVPVSADLEDGFADDPAGIAETYRLAREAGLAGGSIEDWTGEAILDLDAAAERVAVAARSSRGPFVLTGRAENHIRGRDDLEDTLARLRAYQEAGADVLFAPGVVRPEDVRRLVDAVDRPVNVLLRPGGPTVAELAAAGAARISVGGALAFVAFGSLVSAASELLDEGTNRFSELSARGLEAVRRSVTIAVDPRLA